MSARLESDLFATAFGYARELASGDPSQTRGRQDVEDMLDLSTVRNQPSRHDGYTSGSHAETVNVFKGDHYVTVILPLASPEYTVFARIPDGKVDAIVVAKLGKQNGGNSIKVQQGRPLR